MKAAFTRRAFLAALPTFGQAAETIASQAKRLRDPVTEFELTRLTDPTFNSWLVSPPTRSISHRSSFAVICSDRSGDVQAYRLDLKNGETQQLTQAHSLDHNSIALMPDDRSLCFFDGDTLLIGGAKPRTVYQVENGWKRAGGFTIADDGSHALFVESNDTKYRLRMMPLLRGTPVTVIEKDTRITFVRPRPRRASILYGTPDGAWVVDYTGQNNRRLKTLPGMPLQAIWSADGKSFTYLRAPENPTELNDVREHIPDTNEDKRISSTSQFVTYARNSDSSVFVGISRNKAAPYVLLLLRVAHRELTIAEHRASNPASVSVLFTPNSQRLLWHTDREGKFGIYTLAVEKFVEETEETGDY